MPAGMPAWPPERRLYCAIAYRVPGEQRNRRFSYRAEATRLVTPVFRKGWELKL